MTPRLLALTPSPIRSTEPDDASPLATLASWRAAGRSTHSQAITPVQRTDTAQLSQATATDADLTPREATVTAAQVDSPLALEQVTPGNQGRNAGLEVMQAGGSPTDVCLTSPELNGLSAVLLPLTPSSASPAVERQAASATPNSHKGKSAVAQKSDASSLGVQTTVPSGLGQKRAAEVDLLCLLF